MNIIKPVFPYPALVIESTVHESNRKFLVLSDLHLGYESLLINHGINLNLEQMTNTITNNIKNIGLSNNCDGIILLGDLKNTINHIDITERKIINLFFDSLLPTFDIYFIPGNHDGGIEKLLPSTISSFKSSGMILNDTLLIHGHIMIKKLNMQIKNIVMGHLHSIVTNPNNILRGKQIWIFLKIDSNKIYSNRHDNINIFIIPSFNQNTFSSNFFDNKTSKKRNISPLIRKIIETDSILDAFIFTLDGSLIGDQTNIKDYLQ